MYKRQYIYGVFLRVAGAFLLVLRLKFKLLQHQRRLDRGASIASHSSLKLAVKRCPLLHRGECKRSGPHEGTEGGLKSQHMKRAAEQSITEQKKAEQSRAEQSVETAQGALKEELK